MQRDAWFIKKYLLKNRLQDVLKKNMDIADFLSDLSRSRDILASKEVNVDEVCVIYKDIYMKREGFRVECFKTRPFLDSYPINGAIKKEARDDFFECMCSMGTGLG